MKYEKSNKNLIKNENHKSSAGNSAGLYVHLPFCEKRCNYCDFYSQTNLDERLVSRYVNALCNELELWAKEFDFYNLRYGEKYQQNLRIIDTIFIGGGTPSAIEARHIERIMDCVRAYFKLAEDAEISMEANPNSLTGEKLLIYKNIGINRLSIGVQSFEDADLKFLGRLHDSKTAEAAFKLARKTGFDNINLDLMFAYKENLGKSATENTCEYGIWENAKKMVQKAIELSPEHISMYSLQLEEGTKLYEEYMKGAFDLPSEEADRFAYHEGAKMLKTAGYGHYEISNFAKPGFECRHNLKYWSMAEYIGAGASASSYVMPIFENCNSSDFKPSKTKTCGKRKTNVADIIKYIEQLEKAEKLSDINVAELHENKLQDDMSDYVITTMRTARGLSFSDFKLRYGIDFYEAFPNAKNIMEEHVKHGLLEVSKGSMRFTLLGVDVSNSFLAEFV